MNIDFFLALSHSRHDLCDKLRGVSPMVKGNIPSARPHFLDGVKLLPVLLVLLLIWSVKLNAQSIQESIHVIARAHEDSIVLRWAPSTPAAWKLLNQYGYKIERYTLGRDGKAVPERPMVMLSPELKPAPQREWELWMDQDDMVAVAAQAIYGEEFNIDIDKSDLMQLYQKARELETRYSFGLFAADLSAKAAELSGLRVVDSSVKKNEMYLYRVYSLVPEDIAKIEMGFVYTGVSEAYELPRPLQPEIEEASETAVLIRWETFALKNIYVAYYLERSIDGEIYEKVSDQPMTILTAVENGSGLSYSAMSDTVVVNRQVFYRVRGVTSFAETGPPSEALMFTGEYSFTTHPTITRGRVLDNQSVQLEWDYEDESIGIVKSFDIERSNKADQGYKVIGSMPEGGAFEFYDNTPMGTNYYRVAAVSLKGMRNYSHPYLIQLEDSIPPSAPIGLKAVADTTGLVQLTWTGNKEQDLLGYRIYRSPFKSNEFSQITRSPVEITSYTDTVTVRTLSNKMYYKLVAIDNRFNPSLYSDIIEVRLPDVVPPVPPVVRRMRAEERGVLMAWVPSSSVDVKHHIIYRRSAGQPGWTEIARFDIQDTTRQHIDSLVVSRTRYEYAMVAEDSSGLRSVFSKAVVVVTPQGSPLGMSKVIGVADRQQKTVKLSWQKADPGIVKFIIYRASEQSPITMYKSISAPASSFSDDGITMNTTYIYRVKAVYTDGRESAFSNEVRVNY